MRSLLFASLVVCSLLILTQCNKKDCNCSVNATNSRLNYGDSVFYLKNSVYTISPNQSRTGTYTAFPDNLQIDHNTGKITVMVNGVDGNSQTGLWYKIMFKSTATNEIDSTYILLSGINYLDKFYQLNQNDSIINPVYNGDPTRAIPTGNYDIQHDNDFAINPNNGQINIKECIRRGYFSKQPSSGWQKVSVKYAINDNSNGALNQIDIILYYYNTIADVPSNVSRLMQAHQAMTLGYRMSPVAYTVGDIDTNLSSDLSMSKPRPPCVVIIGH